MPKSPYLANLFLDTLLGANGAAVLTITPSLYLALFTVQPTDASAGTEVSGGSYSRMTINNTSATWTAAALRVKSNAAELLFPAATAGWGTIVGWALFDAASGGNMLWRGTFAGPIRADSGDLFTIKAGALTVTEN